MKRALRELFRDEFAEMEEWAVGKRDRFEPPRWYTGMGWLVLMVGAAATFAVAWR